MNSDDPPQSAQPAMQAWSGRFSEPVDERVKRFTASVLFDQRLASFDIAGSLAHARMLASRGILSLDDLAHIERGMAIIAADVEAGRFRWSVDLEDVHLNIERRLTELVGDAGKRLHTARSRNDQVATDVRLWLRETIDRCLSLLADLRGALLDLAESHAATIMPGFTHLQVAQPVTFGHHLMAYVEMFERDAERLADARRRVNRLPLGAAALAGTGYPIDREQVARALGFEGICRNSLDAVSDRDFAIEFCACAALAMTHLSRLSEELILWMSPRFGFIDLADRFCTGSSIMPQKKNPDVPELVRGKTGRVNGHLVALLTLMKAQPLAYNKDNQEDKEPLFDTADTLVDSLAVYAAMMRGVTVNAPAMARAAAEGFSTATDLADYLVRKGLPFREAHEAVARAVRAAQAQGRDLAELPLDALRAFSPLVEADVYAVLTLEGSVASRTVAGGTAPAQVRAAVAEARRRLPGATGG
ncbi:MAG: argininosuccinate lyase [Rhodocyclaceae bacterium]|nr:argininosuccinate lyase [Rhodocyclaceae bacterium]MCA3133993.1 argininosuccinate lyase [Rhodocyclaceae bacterium]MCA3141740.1 argininosuccinate lyase [Rhodocyclaceae bacterium]MCA3146047.1 argininosuccinate lyase [Rhodocyclaceae bacterium]MCE2896882.1 argininosuccinate lyase [Betaproteobacteria bacterium]